MPPKAKQTDNSTPFDQTATPSTKYEDLIRNEIQSDVVNESTTSTPEQLVNTDVNSHENTSTTVTEQEEEKTNQEQKEELKAPPQTTTHHVAHEHSHHNHKSSSHHDKPAAKMEYLRPRIAVCGVGGAGCNAVNYMMQEKCDGVEYYVINTDPQSLGYVS